MALRSVILYALAAVCEIGGCWLVWQGFREQRGLLWVAAGVLVLGLYGVMAAAQPDANFGRVLAAYGGVFIIGSLLWGIVLDGFRPGRWDVAGAVVCLLGVFIIIIGSGRSTPSGESTAVGQHQEQTLRPTSRGA